MQQNLIFSDDPNKDRVTIGLDARNGYLVRHPFSSNSSMIPDHQTKWID